MHAMPHSQSIVKCVLVGRLCTVCFYRDSVFLSPTFRVFRAVIQCLHEIYYVEVPAADSPLSHTS